LVGCSWARAPQAAITARRSAASATALKEKSAAAMLAVARRRSFRLYEQL